MDPQPSALNVSPLGPEAQILEGTVLLLHAGVSALTRTNADRRAVLEGRCKVDAAMGFLAVLLDFKRRIEGENPRPVAMQWRAESAVVGLAGVMASKALQALVGAEGSASFTLLSQALDELRESRRLIDAVLEGRIPQSEAIAAAASSGN